MIRRIAPRDLTDQQKDWLLAAAEEATDEIAPEELIQRIMANDLGVWDINGDGIIGLTRTDKVLWVELLRGDVKPHKDELMTWLVGLAAGRRIEGLPNRPGMVKVLEKLGFKPIATLMRYEP